MNSLLSKFDFSSPAEMRNYLNHLPTFSSQGQKAANFGVETIQNFLDHIGSPHLSFSTVHVAGTNGKGTTCRVLASILMASGYKTGITTSPHLVTYHERIQVDQEKISDEEMLAFFRETGHVLEKFSLTYFELITAAAFWYFARNHVDVAVIETGLGGRLDATNVVKPICSVITSISLDHTDLLGDSISAIAREKGGIIKPNVPLVIGQLQPEATSELEILTEHHQSPLIMSRPEDIRRNGERIEFKVPNVVFTITKDELSDVDLLNLPVVLKCTSILQQKGFGAISSETIIKGLKHYRTYFPLRSTFSKISTQKSWYYDGAHNIESLSLLLTQLEKVAPLEDWTLIFSIMKDKLRPEIPIILSGIGRLFYVPLKSERAATYAEILDCWNSSFAYAEDAYPRSESERPLPPILLTDISEISGRFSNELVIFTGSFYFYEPLMMSECNHPPFHT